MLFKGTERRSARQITEDIERLGGDINAYTSAEHTCFHATASGRHMPQVLDVLGDMYLNSRLENREVDRERNVIKEEILMTRDQPDELVDEELAALMWPNHALGRPLTGTEDTLAGIGREHLAQHMRRHYVPARTIITAAGNLDAERFQNLIQEKISTPDQRINEKMQSGIPGGAVPPLPRPRHTVIPRRDLEQMHLQLGYRSFGWHDPRRFALNLMNIIFGGNMSSRLFQRLREQLGLCYSIDSSSSYYEDTGSLEVMAGLDSDKFAQALEALRVETDKMLQKPVSEQVLRNARDYSLGQMEIALESPSHQMFHMGDCLMSYGRVIDPIEEEEQIMAVTAEDVLEVAREVLGGNQLAIAAVVPEEKAGQADRLLGRHLEQRLVA
jgi:predicted Zn-dependent peptidase